MTVEAESTHSWVKERIKEDEITRFLDNGKDFIPDQEITEHIEANKNPDPKRIRDILDKSLAIQNLDPAETASLIHVTDEALLDEMCQTALKVKKKVYDNRIVTFAPLYMGNLCVNNCAYCGFRDSNEAISRGVLTDEDIRSEVRTLAGAIGHKRLIAVYGEHPSTDIDYMVRSIETIYDTKVKTRNGKATDGIRRVNVNAAPLSVDALKKLYGVGIGTYQVFQESYHKETYAKMHPKGTLKSHYLWRLYCMHRALEAGFDDVGIGALFGLYDWRFEVMGLLYHARELEEKLGIGPHTISFPRLEPAINTPFTERSPYEVSDEELKRIILILRLSVPHVGMIITAREDQEMRRAAISMGVTQTDASTKIGVGTYSNTNICQAEDKQQFRLGDTRSLDEVVRELAEMGYITSFCTAGYRCGRTGKCIMDLLRSGQEGKFCKLNAVLTYQEWLDDFASPKTKAVARPVMQKEVQQIKERMPKMFPTFQDYYKRIQGGERDLYL